MSRRTKIDEVAATLERRIRANEFPPHTNLPSLADLGKEFDVAEGTVVAAIKELSRLGLVTSVRAYATVVRDWRAPRQVLRDRAVYKDARGTFFDKAAQGWVPTTPKSRVAWEEADDPIAALLGLAIGARVLIRERVSGEEVQVSPGKRVIVPKQVCSTTVPEDIALEHGLDRDNTGTGGVIDRLEEIYGPLVWIDHPWSRMPTKAEVVQLQLGGDNTPVTCIATTGATSDGKVVVVNDVRMDARGFIVSIPLKRTASAK